MSGKELPILSKGQVISAEHYKGVTQGVNSLRAATGDKRYIVADIRSGTLAVRWVGPTVAAAGSLVRRFKVKSVEDDYLTCRVWDGTDEGQTDVLVARSFPDKISYPAESIIFGTQPTGGTGVTSTVDGKTVPVTWLDMRLTVGQFFPVRVIKDGGSDGTGSTKATWTYTVKSLVGDVTLGTAVAVERPRENGPMTFQAGSKGFGVAFYAMDDPSIITEATLRLWDAGEVYTTAVCS